MKSFIFFPDLYISIVFFSCVLCATETGLLNTIQKFLNRYFKRGHNCQRKLQQCDAQVCVVWAAFLQSHLGFPEAARSYTVIFIEANQTP